MKGRFPSVILTLLLISLFVLSSLSITNAGNEKANITCNFDSNKSQIIVTIDSPVNVALGQIDMDIPAEVSINNFECAGFMTGASKQDIGTTKSWIQQAQKKEKTGTLTINVTITTSSITSTISLKQVILIGEDGNKINIDSILPIAVQVSQGTVTTPSSPTPASTPSTSSIPNINPTPAVQQGKMVSLTYNAVFREIYLIIDSPDNIKNSRITMDIPSNVVVEADAFFGFTSKARHITEGTKHSWVQETASGQNMGFILLTLDLLPGSTKTVNLEEVKLTDQWGKPVSLDVQLPITLAINDSTGEKTSSITPVFGIISPHGGEDLVGGSTYQVKWRLPKNLVEIDLFYSVDNGAHWRQIARKRPNTGIYDWKLPNESSKDCLISIETYDSAKNKLNIKSDHTFTMKSGGRGGMSCQ